MLQVYVQEDHVSKVCDINHSEAVIAQGRKLIDEEQFVGIKDLTRAAVFGGVLQMGVRLVSGMSGWGWRRWSLLRLRGRS